MRRSIERYFIVSGHIKAFFISQKYNAIGSFPPFFALKFLFTNIRSFFVRSCVEEKLRFCSFQKKNETIVLLSGISRSGKKTLIYPSPSPCIDVILLIHQSLVVLSGVTVALIASSS